MQPEDPVEASNLNRKMRGESTLLDTWFNHYWSQNIFATDGIRKVDKKVHDLINFLLITGKVEDTQSSDKPSKNFTQQELLKHQE